MTPDHRPSDNRDIRTYYERNSRWFWWAGRRQQSQVIHRPVWAEGIVDRQRALNYVNERIGRQCREMLARRRVERVDLLDLGCGFGATLHYLHRQGGGQIGAVGLTVSANQAQVARRWIIERAAADSCAFLVADFHATPLRGPFDLAVSVEAFAHATRPERYFAEVARLLKPGGCLILCDDFQAAGRPLAALNGEDRRWLALFKRGWHVPHLLSCLDAVELAHRAGLCLVENADLNPYLRTRSFPNLCLPLFEWVMGRQGALAPFLESVVGGWALEDSIRRGNVSYRFLVFEKEMESPTYARP